MILLFAAEYQYTEKENDRKEKSISFVARAAAHPMMRIEPCVDGIQPPCNSEGMMQRTGADELVANRQAAKQQNQNRQAARQRLSMELPHNSE